jgi:Mg-chelatase subunit ChlD
VVSDTPVPPTDTPTNTPVPPTDTPTNTPVPPTNTPVPPTATRTPGPAYLPILLREQCDPTTQRADVALVIDASSSMEEPAAGGTTKMVAAIDAARTFLSELQLTQGDQAAVVWFNGSARLEQQLTNDRAALDAALGRITTANFTRIDLGIKLAREELASPRRLPANTGVMIVLTDGRANPVPVDVAVEEARLAKEAGVQIFTIGLGQDLDTEALMEIASKPEWYYYSPDAGDLDEIYRTIAASIPCPPDAYWGKR